MRKFLMIAACGTLLTLPTLATAQDAAAGATTGAAVGAGTGFLVGGPVGAAVGAGVGGVVGAGAADNERRERRARERAYGYEPNSTVVIEKRSRVQRNCVADQFGNRTCTEVRR
jgi:hypothetical protein